MTTVSCDRVEGVPSSSPSASVVETDPVPQGKETVTVREGQYLIFEFPDGVRGGFGRIVGEKARPLQEEGGTLEVLQGCGAVEPEIKAVWSHSVHIVTKSSDYDFAVVECFKKHTWDHFNVGIGLDPTLRSANLETQEFDNLINNPDRKRPK